MAKKDGTFSNPDSIPTLIRPGIMVYKEDWEALKDVTDERERGLFVDSMIHFDSTGEMPDFGENKILTAIWRFVKPKLIRDQKDYSYNTWKNRYIAATRGMEKENKPTGDEWLRVVTTGDLLETGNKKKNQKLKKETETEKKNLETGNSKSTQSVDLEVDPEIERQRVEMKKRLEEYT